MTSTDGPTWHQEVADFVLRRKKPFGGFSATPRLPPTIQDTYHSLRTLTCLARHGSIALLPADGPLLAYLSRPSEAERHSAKVTFQRLASCRMAGVELAGEPIVAFVRRRLSETSDLEERYYCRRLLREVAGRDDDSEFGWQPAPSSSEPWSFRTATELWMLLTLAQGHTLGSADMITWLQQCQTYDGGFGFLPGTTSFMENGYDCLRALRLLGSAPRDQEGCRAFILACRTRYGGFARRHGATAFLSSTWQAMAALELLEGAGGS